MKPGAVSKADCLFDGLSRSLLLLLLFLQPWLQNKSQSGRNTPHKCTRALRVEHKVLSVGGGGGGRWGSKLESGFLFVISKLLNNLLFYSFNNELYNNKNLQRVGAVTTLIIFEPTG